VPDKIASGLKSGKAIKVYRFAKRFANGYRKLDRDTATAVSVPGETSGRHGFVAYRLFYFWNNAQSRLSVPCRSAYWANTF
jgi:hypothetical protein